MPSTATAPRPAGPPPAPTAPTPDAPMPDAPAAGAAPPPAGIARRLAAFGADACLSSLAVFATAALLMATLGPALRLGPPRTDPAEAVLLSAPLAYLSAAAGVVAGCAYFCVSWWIAGATPGQRLLGLRVCALADGQAGLAPGSALRRWAALGAPLWIAASAVPGWAGILAAAALVGWFACLLYSTAASETGEGLHDRLSGTRVVAARGALPADALTHGAPARGLRAHGPAAPSPAEAAHVR